MPSHIEALENRQFFAATGLPDTSFGGSTAVGTVSFRSDTANAVAKPVKLLVDSGGRSYVVASVPGILEVRRLTREGVTDATYANARGLIGLPIAPALLTGQSPGGVAAAMDLADRLYLLAGDKIYRFTVSGKIDPTFGTKGVATLAGFSGGRDIAIDSHNRIYLSGSQAIGTGTSASSQFQVARLRSNGSIDRTFGNRGVYAVPLPTSPVSSYKNAYSKGEFIRVLNDDSVVAVASASVVLTDGEPRLSQTARGFQSVKFTPAGTIDLAYGNQGVTQQLTASSDVTFSSLAAVGIRADGSVVTYDHFQSDDSDASGSSNGLVNAAGAPNHTYDVDQNIDTDLIAATFDNAPGGGELVVDRTDGVLNRTRADGTLDTDFTSSGTTTPIAHVSNIALSSDGTILTVGTSSKKLSLNVRRLFADDTPVANLAAKPVTASGNATFAVTYASPAGFSSSAGDGSEIGIIKGGVTLHPSVLSRTVVADSIIVRYRLSDSGSPFTSADNGNYVVNLLGNQIEDLTSHAAGARTLGSLTIAIA